MKKTTLFALFLLISHQNFAQKTENLFFIMTDGLRWQEVFQGIDSTLLQEPKFVRNKEKLLQTFGGKTSKESREKLLPFLWNTIAPNGQIYGNRAKGNRMNVLNPYWFSYPGYNEVLTGFADDKINSNDKIWNENITFLETLNNNASFKDKVAAFATWEVIPYIINEERTKIPVNAGLEPIGEPNEKEKLINDIQRIYPSLASNRHDFITYFAAKSYIEKKEPSVLFLSFDETDEFGHESKYDEYLFAANTFDKFVNELWNYCQNHPKYKDKTTFILTTDHGRGDKSKNQWTSHGSRVSDSYQIWAAFIGPSVPALGEIGNSNTILYQNQLAQTALSILGINEKPNPQSGQPIDAVLGK